MAEREETLTAASKDELLVLLARYRRWLQPIGEPRRVPGGREWFVRVRGGVPTLAPAPRPRPRGRTITAVAAAGVVVVAVVVVAAVVAVRWAVAHWPLLVVLGGLGGTLWVRLRRAR